MCVNENVQKVMLITKLLNDQIDHGEENLHFYIKNYSFYSYYSDEINAAFHPTFDS